MFLAGQLVLVIYQVPGMVHEKHEKKYAHLVFGERRLGLQPFRRVRPVMVT